jgi:hypothetical protein
MTTSKQIVINKFIFGVSRSTSGASGASGVSLLPSVTSVLVPGVSSSLGLRGRK